MKKTLPKKKTYNTKSRASSLYAEVIKKHLGNFCHYCNSYENLQIHHVHPLSLGGQNEMSNLEIVCQSCHLKLHKEIASIFPSAGFRGQTFIDCDSCDSQKEYINIVKNERKYYCESCNCISYKKA